jgi:hypothetical protein
MSERTRAILLNRKGRHNPNAKLSDRDISAIRYLMAHGICRNMLARAFQVAPATITRAAEEEVQLA